MQTTLYGLPREKMHPDLKSENVQSEIKTCELIKMAAELKFCRLPRTSQLVMFINVFGIVTIQGYLLLSCFGKEFRVSIQSRKITPPLTTMIRQSMFLSISNSRIALEFGFLEYFGSVGPASLNLLSTD
jgi:hypothetical protein